MQSTPRTIVHLLPTGVEGTAALRNGSEVLVRAAQPRDRELVEVFAQGLSRDALRLRFFTVTRPESVPGEVLTPGTVGDRLSLLIFRQDGPDLHIIGHGEYVRVGPGSPTAEIAFLVADGYRHLGVATLLLRRLARAARVFGIREFLAEVLPENPDMIEVFRSSGFDPQLRWSGRTCLVTVSLLGSTGPAPSTLGGALVRFGPGELRA
ncbi:MAG TPA: GNAT family N-acetyltransferase [Thermoplasmata archaeon]|nr:GNAT family N-acetyltransferase [Thermoplasmata archaeon]